MANRVLKVYDVDSDTTLEDIRFTGGYNIITADVNDAGIMKYRRNLENAKFSDKLWIMNHRYATRVQALIENREELEHLNTGIVNKILFLEDIAWVAKGSMKKKAKWMAKLAKANKQLECMLGYEYIITTRKYYTGDMTDEQLYVLFYSQLKHINVYGEIDACEIEDWPEIIATIGVDWAEPHSAIPNILAPGFEFKKLRKNQISLFDQKLPKFEGNTDNDEEDEEE